MESQSGETFPQRPHIVFMGTPEFAVPPLEFLASHGHRVSAVVTQPDRPKGRGRKLIASPVKEAALRLGIGVRQPQRISSPEFVTWLRETDPDLVVVVAFGQLLKPPVLETPRWGVLNVHASLLPKYRGAAPIQWAVLNDESITGLTAMRMDEGMDTGPILLQEAVSIDPEETAGELHNRLSRMAGEFLVKTLEELAAGNLQERAQDDAEATYAPKIHRGLARVDWGRPAREVSARIRAMDPWPGAVTTAEGKEVKLFSAKAVKGEKAENPTPGTVLSAGKNGVRVKSGDHAVLVRELQVAGKKRLPAGAFLSGFPLSAGAVLGE